MYSILLSLSLSLAIWHNGQARIQFSTTEQHFGQIRPGRMVVLRFGFRNTGTEPLLVRQVAASCGCTVPIYPRGPVLPGDSGVIAVKFNSLGREGRQTKQVAVHTNDPKSPHKLTIRGEVLAH